MAQDSWLWTTGATGDGATAYTQAKCIRWQRQTFCGADNEGVLKDYLNELATTGTSSPVATNTGGAYVHGFPYYNSASVDTAIPTPSANTRVDLIVLRADWTAQTVRITRVAGTEGAGAPSLTQTDGTTWDVPLAQCSITTGGVITVTDTREFLHPNIAVDGDMIDDDAVDSQHYAAGSIDLAHMSANSVDSGQYVDGSIDLAHMSANSVDSAQYVDGSIDTVHLASRTRVHFVPAIAGYGAASISPQSCLGNTLGGIPMADGITTTGFGNFIVKSDFVSTMTIKALIVPSGTGNFRGQIICDIGACGQAYDTHVDTGTLGQDAVTINYKSCVRLTSLTSVAADDTINIRFARDGGDASDTVGATATLLGFIVSYTADS